MIKPGAPDRGDRLAVDVLGKIDAGDLGPQSAGYRMYL
jgi:hypothetical protein